MMHVIVAAALSAAPGRCHNGPPQDGTAVWRPETVGGDLEYTFTYCPEDACLRQPGQNIPQEDNNELCHGNQLKRDDSRFLDVNYLCKAATDEHSVSRDRCMNIPTAYSGPQGVFPNQYPYLHLDGDAYTLGISSAYARTYDDAGTYTSWGRHDADAVASDGTTLYRYYFNQDYAPSAAIDCSGLALYEETTTPTTTTTTITATTTTTTTTATTSPTVTTATTTGPGGLCSHSATFGAPRSPPARRARHVPGVQEPDHRPRPSFLCRRHGSGRRQRAGRVL
jgi:hypothetical protein